MRRALLFAPLLLLALFVVAVAWRLAKPPTTVIASHLVGQPLPKLTLPAAHSGQPGLAPVESGPRLINLFASWCVPCIGEAPLLLELQRGGIVIDGIAVRDRRQATAAFLTARGNPYRAIGDDRDGRAQLLLGASGVPETFLVDRKGIIRLQHIGPIEPEDLAAIRAAWATAQ